MPPRNEIPPWDKRPIEVATILNPAFCGVLLIDALNSYCEHNEKIGMPYPLAFLILPMILHRGTRDILPNHKSGKTLADWFENIWLANYIHPEFVQRTRYLVPYTKEAIIFSMSQRFITFDQINLHPTEKKYLHANLSWEKNSETSKYRKNAKFLGSWLAETGSPARVFNILRINL